MSNTADNQGDLSPEQKRALLATLLQEKAQEEVHYAPLSYGQRSLWFMFQLDPASSAYNVMYAARVREDFDRDAFTRAFQSLVNRHAVLRTTYTTRGGVPMQAVQPYHKLEMQVIDAAGWPWDELQEEIQLRADVPFDLEEGPVLRVQLFERTAGEEPVVLFTAHHIALDFWSFDLLFDELEALYRQEVTERPAQLRPVHVQYTDFVRWQENLLQGEQGRQLGDYWIEQLSGELPNLDLPTDRPRPPVQTFRGKSYHFQLSDELSRKLIHLAQDQSATLYATLLAAFQVLLFRYTAQDDILVGSPTAGRNRAELEDVLGYFLNPIVLRARFSADQTFAECLAQVRETVIGGIAHQDFPFPLLVEQLHPPRDASRSPIFQVAFGWDKPRRLREDETQGESRETKSHTDPGRLGLEPFALGQQGAAFDLMLMMLNMGESLSAALQYNSDLFDLSTVVRMVGHFETLLEAIVADPDRPLADLALLKQDETRMVLETWNETRRDYPRDRCLHELFEAQAATTPDHVAVESDGRQATHATLTYAQLNGRVNQLARYLTTLGIGPDTLVGICVERSLEMMVGILGVLKAGGAYVPLAPGTPRERLAYMLEYSQAPVLLTQRHLAGDLPQHAAKVVCLDEDWPSIAEESSQNLERTAKPHNLAYVIFTSGSTGNPKGVQLQHRSVVNFLESMRREPGIGPQDSLLAVTTLSFDISVLELFLPLTVGGRVVIVGREVAADGNQLIAALADRGATIMQATPATWRLLIEAGWQGDPQLKVLCGGEALPRDLAELLLDRCASLWNMYGPTETTIWSTVDRVRTGQGSVPIGRPIANTQIYILDSRLRPVPVGVPGDLYIAGDGLARGYLDHLELTAERFVANPFVANPFVADPFDDRAAARMYKTGDMARYRQDGNIEFLGRQDFQVKVRGFRIELGDIEANLNEHPEVSQAVVTARQVGSRSDDKQLVAYLVPATESRPNTSQLREFLRDQLPDYMLPATFIWLESFPLNPAGKIDRKALPEPDSSRPELQAEYTAPRDETQQALAEIWASVLGLDEVGIHDNFFDLGGASIQSLEISAGAERAGLKVTPAMLFQYPTIASLAAAAVAVVAPAATPPAEIAGTSGNRAATVIAPAQEAKSHAAPVPTPQPTTAIARKTRKSNTVIESVGVYLPPNEVTTKEVINGCKKRMWFPLERMTGIRSRRMAGETEFSIDLARKAIDECLAHSKYDVDDIDVVISCNITRIDKLRTVSIEPNTSMQLKKHFGFKNAFVFDITNACTGMFTAISIVDAFLSTGLIRRGLVVSGEFITDITRTAQLEIDSFMDPRLACLTVGDAGAALVLEAAAGRDVGFHELDMYSLSKYSRMCIGRLTEQPHGGAIMHVPDPMEHTSVAVHHSVTHAKHILEQSNWAPEKMQHLIMHQTSDRSLRDAKRAINKAFRKKICNDDNTINNLAERGNTATTSHVVAIWDNILNGRIKSGDNALLGITGSGQTIGTGIYTFDDLPDRLRRSKQSGQRPAKVHPAVAAAPALEPAAGRIQVQSVGTIPLGQAVLRDTFRLSALAANNCLQQSPYECNDIELLIFGGMQRTEYISEPAIATLIARELQMNDLVESTDDKKTFAFDVYNAALGTLQACQVASQMILAGNVKTAMVVASEVALNAEHFPDELMGLYETASALILDRSSDGTAGFGRFVFKYFTEFSDSRVAMGRYRDGKPFCDLRTDARLEQQFLECIPQAVQELLDQEGLKISDIKAVLPPQFSSEFNRALADVLGVAASRVVDVQQGNVQQGERDLFTSSLPYALQQVQTQQLAERGDVGLIVNVASGIQVGCATYYF